MSEDQKPPSDQRGAGHPARQPVFLLPASVTALCAVLLAIQLAQSLVLNEDGRDLMLTWLAFIPYRIIDPTAYLGGAWPLIWTSVTHTLLHASWEHVGFNVVWLAIFGTPVVQRYGVVKMLAMFFGGAAIGAWAFAAIDHGANEYLIGASGGIAALTGAATRFIFQPPVVEVDEATGERRMVGRHLGSLLDVARNPTARTFALAWLILNGLVPLLPAFLGPDTPQIAWQTHIAGFLAGLLLVPLFERRHP
jgi:membrane associated rhomboid family serine protease